LLRTKELIGNIAGTIEMISDKVDEPFINQQHLDELEALNCSNSSKCCWLINGSSTLSDIISIVPAILPINSWL
jgi:hypothetical protein